MTDQFRSYLNLLTLEGLSPKSFAEIHSAGYAGVQFASPATALQRKQCRETGLQIAASGRINEPEEADSFAERCAGEGFVCATLHVGWGLEDNDRASRLIESILTASSRHGFPLYVETHRATICQDMWRTVGFVGQFPELTFNGDFSHWYTGQEMVYGGFEKKLQFIEPVLKRVRFVHGRIGNPGCIQVRVEAGQVPEPEYVGHFRRLWTECFRQFPAIFAPELLSPDIYYGRTFPDSKGGLAEESDRWEQCLVLRRIAEQCFGEARR